MNRETRIVRVPCTLCAGRGTVRGTVNQYPKKPTFVETDLVCPKCGGYGFKEERRQE